LENGFIDRGVGHTPEVVASPPKEYEIVVIGDRCKECSLCINICPKDVLARGQRMNKKGYRATVPVKPEACVGCRVCEWACPDFALFVRPSEKAIGRVEWSNGEEVISH
jgi:2-oxoglutarate ferredoxin oxidoreductase subunit delta